MHAAVLRPLGVAGQLWRPAGARAEGAAGGGGSLHSWRLCGRAAHFPSLPIISPASLQQQATMSGELADLTPASLKLAVEGLPRRALQSLAKKQGVKVRGLLGEARAAHPTAGGSARQAGGRSRLGSV